MNEDSIVLNSAQISAITHGEGPLLIIAGAGTGKTTVITERIKYLVLEKNILPKNILALTFTEKSAVEMTERIDSVMPYGYTQMAISTFHSFCDQVLRAEAIHIGLNPDYRLVSEAELVLFLQKNIIKLQLDYFMPLGNPTKFLQSLLQHFSRLRDEDISPNDYLEYASKISKEKTLEVDEIRKIHELARAYDEFEKLKIKESIMDFSNLISSTLLLFRTRKNVLKKYQELHTYILVDEYQDTNYAQNQLALLLAGKRKNITVVGDDDQAIYRWRGAAIANMLAFRKTYPEAKVISLIENYRSSKEILNAAYSLIQNNNPNRLEVRENINKKLVAANKLAAEKVTLIFEENNEDEADAVAKTILDLVSKKKYSFIDIALLVRANDHAIAFTRSFERLGIPYQFLGPTQLFLQDEIRDLIAYLQLLHDFEDSIAVYRVLTMPQFSILPKDIALLLNYAKRNNYSLFETLEHISELSLTQSSKDKIQELLDNIKKHLSLVPKETAGQILYKFLVSSGLLQSFASQSSQVDEVKVKNIATFFDKLKHFETEFNDASVHGVVNYISLLAELGDNTSTENNLEQNMGVSILTVHASKGLEFPVVFLVNLVSERFPTRQRSETIPIPQEFIKEELPEGDYHLQEERRLFYVGMTRAKNKLYLTGAKYYGQGKREKKLSPYVYEVLSKSDIDEAMLKNDKNDDQLSLFNWSNISSKNELNVSQTYQKFPITYLSYSQIQTYDMCPLHYKLKYILKIPVIKLFPAPSFGTSIHETLRKFYQAVLDGEEGSVELALSILEKSWSHLGYESRDHEKKAYERAVHVIKQYVINNFDENNLPLSLETPFIFGVKGLKIGGRIDRVDKTSDGKIEIIDYKTGNNIPTQSAVDNNLQLTIYALAATKLKDALFNKSSSDIVLTLHFVEQDIKLTTTRTQTALDEAEKILQEKAIEIAKSDFQCSKSIFCKSCEYSLLCFSQST